MLYQTMNHVVLFTIVIVVLLIWFGSRRNPLSAFLELGKELLRSYKFLLIVAGMISVLTFNKYELQIEKKMHLGSDFTSFIFGLEGHFVQHVQQLFYAPWLTPVIVFFYIFMLQSVLGASLGVYLLDKNRVMLYATCYTIMLVYAVAIPFYLYFPVNEVWAYAPAGVRFTMLDVFPRFEQEYRPLSGLNNCFPSLHTAISVSTAILAYRSGNRRWMAITTVSAALIVFGIFYLGIHWLTDMIGGTILAVVSTSVAVQLAKLTLRSGQETLTVPSRVTHS
ncbi:MULTISPECIES: phosphatase PAP2 family protein [unclassified Paenibacillus]|uniref:phosphatase PAP2 family protein n=2 Tax=unclassified Paenibacillus TaxID=185978 RepID=UPI00240734F3|nr:MULTISPECIES: phosphatase PAP2 family protein [unclassified Paenibacillus]MDF9850530.1 membrane-associated phospholipid phosphatase [Paenibacillus sp. PastM-2]MDH6481515.1 membrane-associated phospholipid phosphatase [Paenibacillus sp. PastH-2]MDF9843925.1 membrane-associated phospholipid phosphatase [Paenibacillus sp. PastF-2]MDF9856256.1 membrane-associated phospholipid phosphatase [Paenibacillus sp. PastF-1]MDH6509829.1 membrane-associated phospholipid phosphatase [Paenibacillus sp. Past